MGIFSKVETGKSIFNLRSYDGGVGSGAINCIACNTDS